MSKSGVPYGGVLLTGSVYILGVILNLVLPSEAFEIALNFSALGIVAMWSMIMISCVSGPASCWNRLIRSRHLRWNA